MTVSWQLVILCFLFFFLTDPRKNVTAYTPTIMASVDMVKSEAEQSKKTIKTTEKTTILKLAPIKTPKVKVQRPNVLDEFFHQTRQKRSVYYFTAGRKINLKKYENYKTKENENPFELPPVDNLLKKRAVEKEAKVKEKQLERTRKVYDKHTYRTKQLIDFPERLYMPMIDEEKVQEGILDIDKQFFTIVKGRPLKEKRSDLKQYVRNVKDGLLSRLKTGIIYDEIYLIERQQDVETRTIENIKQNLQDYSNSFDEFLAKDNDRSMKLLREASEEANKTNIKREELNAVIEGFVKVKCQIYELETIWSKRKACKDFLYEISPESFKEKYEKLLAKMESSGKVNAKEKGVAEEIKLSDSLESLLEPFLKDDAVIKPPLYFTQPWELKFIFRDMELKNQNALVFLESLVKPNEIAVACLNATNDYYEKETKIIEESLADLEQNISLEEKRAAALNKKVTKLVNTTFKNMVSGEKPILLHAHVQNAYEACIAPEGSKLSVLEMLRDLEIEYKNLLLQLDRLPIEIVKEAKMFIKEDTAYVKSQAKDARKKINYLDILIRRMLRAVEPPVEKTTRPLVFRSRPPPPLPKPAPPPKEMSVQELEHIHFFTDKTTDPIVDDTKIFFPLGY